MTDEDRQMYEELCGYENLIELIRIELTTGQLVSRAYRALQLIEERNNE